MNFGIIVSLILINMVYSLRPFQSCNKCSFKRKCVSNTKRSFITKSSIWKDYDNDPNPPVDIEKENSKFRKLFVDDIKSISELEYNYEVFKIFRENKKY